MWEAKHSEWGGDRLGRHRRRWLEGVSVEIMLKEALREKSNQGDIFYYSVVTSRLDICRFDYPSDRWGTLGLCPAWAVPSKTALKIRAQVSLASVFLG